jgi:Mrp family chromosome partitioning ATPase
MANGHGKKPEDFKKQMEDSMRAPENANSHVKKVIGIVSGKGGVGKSLVTGLSASLMNKKGYKTAIMDADITGPSIPKMFGIGKLNYADENGNMLPATTEGGMKVMSLNMLMENETDPVIWRGPVIAGIVKQFWSDVNWGDIEYMFVDMPPGTGDVALTVMQSLPVDGIVIVTSPQELVGMIVSKAVKMAEMMNVPVLGIVENMSYFKCPDCGGIHEIFGKSRVKEAADEYGIDTIVRLPIDPELSGLCDQGRGDVLGSEGLPEEFKKLSERMKTLKAVE